jgi:hypothetical protein
MLNSSRFGLCVLGLLSSAAIGCNSGEPFEMVPIHGKVTYDDGSLIKAQSIQVTFNPVGVAAVGKQFPPGGTANVNVADGTFSSVTTRRVDDGVLLGKHKVAVMTFQSSPVGGPPIASHAVPQQYQKSNTTPLEVTVERPDQFVELKVPKP